jgi:uncharacterized protein YjiS (DUF1127 family)
MSAPITKDQLTFALGNLTYVDTTYDEAPVSVVKPHGHGIGSWLAGRLAALSEWHRRRGVMQEMALMTDRELSDIGLSRSDLVRVFDPSFAADRIRGRDYIAY